MYKKIPFQDLPTKTMKVTIHALRWVFLLIFLFITIGIFMLFLTGGDNYITIIVGYSIAGFFTFFMGYFGWILAQGIIEMISGKDDKKIQGISYYIKKKRKPLIDAELKRNLKMQNIKFSDILPKGKVIRLRQTANVFGGGITINVTDKVHPYYKKVAVKACQEIGLNIAGVDLMTYDITKKNDYRVIEINSFPALDMHEHPDKGKPINVSKLILKSIFPRLK